MGPAAAAAVCASYPVLTGSYPLVYDAPQKTQPALYELAHTASDNRERDGNIGAGGMAAVTSKVLEGGRTAKVHKWWRELSEDDHCSHLIPRFKGTHTVNGSEKRKNSAYKVRLI
jgi:hypothetical protein